MSRGPLRISNAKTLGVLAQLLVSGLLLRLVLTDVEFGQAIMVVFGLPWDFLLLAFGVLGLFVWLSMERHSPSGHDEAREGGEFGHG